jgi:hypothetical protein
MIWVVPVHGLGQCNGDGPTIWEVASTPLLNMLQAQGFGFLYMTCITHKEIHLVGNSVVDDTYIVESHPEDQDPQATAARMQGGLGHMEWKNRGNRGGHQNQQNVVGTSYCVYGSMDDGGMRPSPKLKPTSRSWMQVSAARRFSCTRFGS